MKLFRLYSATMPLNDTVTLCLAVYWDGEKHADLGRTQMPLKINEALERWKNVAMLGGQRFTLEEMAGSLIRDQLLDCARVIVSDNHGNGVDATANDARHESSMVP